MDSVIVRYGEIGTKSAYVQDKMRQLLRQRIADRLEYEEIDFEKVATAPGRMKITGCGREAIKPVSELPGVTSVSPVIETKPEIQSIKQAAKKFDYGDSFGVKANRSGQHKFDSQDICRELGSYIEELTGAEVDLDDPDTWFEVDLRRETAYVFIERVKGPGGLPVGSQDSMMALISGGIDSPVAAYRLMLRGADITPIYFYNKPIAAEDHLIRVERSVKRLKRYNPSKNWEMYQVDMESINQKLLEYDRGRMVAQRVIMFKIAEKLAEADGLNGLITGESLGQKSTQTTSNLSLTSSQINLPVHRPLIGYNKDNIVKLAKQVGNFEEAKIDSACSTIAPDNPATSLDRAELQKILSEIDAEDEIRNAVDSAKKVVV